MKIYIVTHIFHYLTCVTKHFIKIKYKINYYGKSEIFFNKFKNRYKLCKNEFKKSVKYIHVTHIFYALQYLKSRKWFKFFLVLIDYRIVRSYGKWVKADYWRLLTSCFGYAHRHLKVENVFRHLLWIPFKNIE